MKHFISLFVVLFITTSVSLFAEEPDAEEEAVTHFETALDASIKMDNDVLDKVKDYQDDVRAFRAQREKVKLMESEVEELQDAVNRSKNRLMQQQNQNPNGGGDGGGSGGGVLHSGSLVWSPYLGPLQAASPCLPGGNQPPAPRDCHPQAPHCGGGGGTLPAGLDH